MDTFGYQTTERQRRLDPRAFKLAVLTGLVVFSVGTFARWVANSERSSLAKIHASEGAGAGSNPLTAASAVAVGAAVADASAKDAAEQALGAAQGAFAAHGTLEGVDATALALTDSSVTFVAGPSTGAQVVSTITTSTAWAGAVMSSSGSCFAVRLAANGSVTYGTGPEECTGSAALTASDPSW
jgi:hypothetical protein